MRRNDERPSDVDWSVPPRDIDTIAQDLRALRTGNGGTSYAEIARRIEERRAARGIPEHERRLARSTVYDCFKAGRKRLDIDLSVEIAAVLGLDDEQLPRWLDRCVAAQGVADSASVVPLRTEIPPPVPEFLGRRESIASILQRIDDGASTVWIDGMPGMGKTQLALHIAAVLKREGWKTGIFVDLGGHRGNAPAASPDAVAEAILRHIGAREHVSKPNAARGKHLRAHLAASKTVLILDDARDGAQVAEIVGDAAQGIVLVTSRNRPRSGVSALTALTLEEFDTAESIALLGRLSDSTAVETDLPAAARLADAAGRLPLALTLTGRRLSAHPGWTLADHAELIEKRLSENRIDDRVRNALVLSVAELDQQADQMLRLIADAPVSDIDTVTAAAITGATHQDAATALTTLEHRNLVVPRGDGRFALHALVRAFAADRCTEIDSPRERASAFGRLGDHIVATVWAAYATLSKSTGDTPRPARFEYAERAWSSEEAESWLTRHLDDILSVAYAATARDHPQVLIRISEGISWWLNLTGRHEDAISLHEAAAQTASSIADATAFASASLDVGQIFASLGRAQEALVHLRRAARLEGDLDDPGITGLLLNMIGVALVYSGELEQSVISFERGAQVHRALDQSNRLLSCLVNLGVAQSRLGLWTDALAVNDEALAVAEVAGHRLMYANLTVNRAQLFIDLDDRDAALTIARRGLELSNEVNFMIGTVNAETMIGQLLRLGGDLEKSREHLSRALDLARKTTDTRLCAEVGIELCRLLLDEGDDAGLRALLEETGQWSAQAEDPLLHGQFARLQGDAASDPDEQIAHWRAAAELLESMRSPLAREIRELLDAATVPRA
ncbi:MAG TPA: hypothetical protein DIW46_01270 [Microbacterium sp.]|uniref:NB-ARC domain-containing protein n=1 Tax=Microbacterium sp. TaxID=51671 RepID=UPI000EE1E91F|nr:hypothetical protein [Microbacterium sp.]